MENKKAKGLLSAKSMNKVGGLVSNMTEDDFNKLIDETIEMSFLFDTIKNIEQWGAERGITGGEPSRQLNKLTEELGELAEGFNKKVPEQIEDSLGDMFVVMTLFAEQNGLNIIDCIESAYDTIKDREGKNVDGIFVKKEDLED